MLHVQMIFPPVGVVLQWLSDRPTSVLVVIIPVLAILLILSLTRIWTTIAYYIAIHKHKASHYGGSNIVEPPQIPYTIPWLGNALSFVSPQPGSFWGQLFQWHPRSTGALTLLIAGRKTHILFSPVLMQAMFKARSPTRDTMEHDLYSKVFEMPEEEIHLAEAGKHNEAIMNAKFMTNFDRVNELTQHFTRVLGDVLQKDAASVVDMDQVGVYEWLRDRMFTASMTALMGDKLLGMYPTYAEDFFRFDGEFLEFFFSKPAFLMREANARRTRIFTKLEEWNLEMRRLLDDDIIDPENGPMWEPLFGSRLNRARQLDYDSRNLNHRSKACLDAGLAFGLASNVIPATGWMLFYILNPATPDLHRRVLAEIEQCSNEKGTLDIPRLVAQPLLQSLWMETLRLCSDVLVTRTLTEDMYLPLDSEGDRKLFMRKGDDCFAPSWIAQHDPLWSSMGEKGLPNNVFDAERFLTTNAKTGEQTFSMNGTAGMIFPFGGGKTICPGRIFAKQEALGALAMILLRFEFDVKGYIDLDKKPMASFPGFKNAFPGTGALVPGGDMLVKIRVKS